ncbi:hypothetical protein [Thermoleptolyngbya sp. C42_A2020_037]|uniref:hypothetical protein n=1 Tax=Thermoleptolyngbya sp. C42_A2020_037 TaxID=2747799 RepID=UPI0019F18B2A|nr:hypothetical protein [Thermoleptolyngbya sp. C42_A2020_037]MBF2083644.1 hypothetical protein [Thermoleptolyngbya sp. C42_A2020_037]
MRKFNITDKELAEALDISLDKLADICEFFDSDPDDDWDLKEGEHFTWATHGARVFSPEGAVEICNYLEENKEERPFFKRFERWIFRRDQRLKGLMISKRIQEVSTLEGQLVFVNGRAFLSPRACRDVLGLGKRQDVLNRAFQEVQRPKDGNTERESLKPREDFFDEETKGRHFSGTGIALISKHLGSSLTQKHRREWMKVVSEYAPKALGTLEKHEMERKKRIEAAMERVRKQANGKCQLTGRRKSVDKFDLEVHHLFDKCAYPQLADIETNLIAIRSDIHAHFHKWMGGSHVSCTVEDMERYIEEFGTSLFSGDDAEKAVLAAQRLSSAKKMLRALL